MKVTGLKEAISQLQEKQKKIDQDLYNILEDYTLRISYGAKRDAPTDLGHLGQSIGHEIKALKNSTKSSIFANALYGAFREFGTGTKVSVPTGFESLAIKFKGKKIGNFQEFKDDLYDWCKRKGIPKEAWFFVLMKILKVGTRPQPFLIPNYLRFKGKYEQAVKKYKNEIRW